MLVAILMEDKTEESKARQIASDLNEFGLKSELYVASAHKVPELVIDIVNDFNRSGEELVYITLSSTSDALPGMVAATAIHPVIALAEADHSFNFPNDVPAIQVSILENASQAAIRILALVNDGLRKKVAKNIREVKNSF